jgi:D-3-phosphoglycerate dehydrogenase
MWQEPLLMCLKEEPAKNNPLFNLPNVVCTPHLGAATIEAQENVALQIAEQMSKYLLEGAVENALNMPSMSAEEAKVMAHGLNYLNT